MTRAMGKMYNIAHQQAAPANVRLVDLAAEINVQHAIDAILRFRGVTEPTERDRAIARGYAIAALAGLADS